MSIPARWRMITEDDRKIISFQCAGDGVDKCRAPSTWVAERTTSEGVVVGIIESRCPDHIPVRALQTLMPMPVVTREGIRAALTNPPLHPSTPPVEPLASLSETNETPAVDEPEPEPTSTQPSAKIKEPKPKPAPPPAPSSSIPPVVVGDEHLDEDDG